jgi:DNA primase
MADRIPEATLAEIRARISIVDVISGYVALSQSGRNHMGLCPFHAEKTPSFSVHEERGFFHCFGCQVSGNVFTFVSKIEGLTFPEAVRRLAKQAGVTLPESRDPQAQERVRLYRLNELARVYFQRCLAGTTGGDARQYLAQRGLQPEVVKQFRLGFAPPWRNGLVRFLTQQKADLSRAARLGLIGEQERGGYYDKFRHRLMFPITDVVDQPVGFGGRLLPQAEQAWQASAPHRPTRSLPKYINSSDSVVYKKGALVYGLAQAKAVIKSCERALVVEGYIDLLALAQHGHAETVAVLGTALTVDQLRQVRRFTREVYFFFDGDEAGRRAATRAYPLCLEAEVNGRGIFLPQGEDPDSFVRGHGRAALDELIDRAESLQDFYLHRHSLPPGASAFQRAQAARDALSELKPNDIMLRGALLTQVAQHFGVNEEDLRRSAVGANTSQAASRRRPPQAQRRPRRQPALSPQAAVETELLYLMLIDRQLALRAASEGVVAAFQHWQALATEIVAAWQEHDQIDVGTVLDKLPQELEGLAARVSRADVQEPPDEEMDQRQQLFVDCVRRLQITQRKSARERLQQQIREAELRGDDEAVRRRLQQLQQLG